MSDPTATILLIEDERPIRRFLSPAIAAAGWKLIEAETGEAGILEASQRQPDIIILDLGLPDMDGLDVIQRIRDWSRTPILILSARGREGDKVAALDAGADDYVQKPFSIGELMARVRVALRHAALSNQPVGESVVKFGDVSVDLGRRRVERNGVEVHLTPIEYKLLAALARQAGLVITHRQLLKEVWGPGHSQEAHYLRIFVRQLRQKLERDPARPVYLVTELGVGYRLQVDVWPPGAAI